MHDVLTRILAGRPGAVPPVAEAGQAGGAAAPMPQQPGSTSPAGPTIAGAREAAVLALLAALTGGRGGAQGLAEIVGKLRAAGLDAEVESWIAPGPERPLRPAALARAIPPATLDDVAAATGIGREEALAELAQGLPGLLHTLMPQGRLPTRDSELDGIEEADLLRHFGIGRRR